MDNFPMAETQITLINGISVNVYINAIGEHYLVWFGLAYSREEYEEYGMAKDWDETNKFCEETRKKPITHRNLTYINKKLTEINKYDDGVGFCKRNGVLCPINSKLGA